MLRRSISKYTRETLQFFGQPINFLLRQQIGLLLLAVAVTEVAFSASVICLPLYFRTLNAAELEYPIILIIYFLVSLTIAPYFGSLSDRFGRRPLLIVGTSIAALSFIPFPLIFPIYSGFPPSFLILVLSNAMKGVGSAMISGPILAVFADLAPEQNHGETMGKFYLARSAGGAAGYLIGTIVWHLFGADAFFFFMISMFTATMLYIFRFFEPKGDRSSNISFNGEPFDIKDIMTESTVNPFKTVLHSLQNKQFRKFAIAWLAYSTLVGAGTINAPVILFKLTEEGGLEVWIIGVILLVGAAIMGAIQPTIGKLSDNLGRKPFLIIGCVGMSLLLLMLATILKLDSSSLVDLISYPLDPFRLKSLEITPQLLIPAPHLVIVITILLFLLSASCFASSSLGLITDVTEEKSRGREMGFTQAIMATGSILGTSFGATIFATGGTLSVMTFCFGLSLIAVIIIIQFLYETSGFYHFTHKLV